MGKPDSSKNQVCQVVFITFCTNEKQFIFRLYVTLLSCPLLASRVLCS